MEAPAEAGLHGDGKGGLGGLVGKLRPLGGGANLDFNVVENSRDQYRELQRAVLSFSWRKDPNQYIEFVLTPQRPWC